MTVPCSWNNQRSITPCRLIKRLLRLKTWGKRDYIEAVIETAIILMIEYDCDHTLFKKSHESVKVWIPKAAQDPRRLFCSMNALMIRTNNIRKFLESGRPQSLHSGLLIDDNTTEKECNLRPAVLSTAPAIRLTWKEIDLKTYRAMKTDERGNIYSGAWGCMVGNSLQVTYSRTTARETQKPELSQKQKQIHCKHFRVSCITKCVFMKQKDLQMN